jgi:exonuclease SbcD
MRILHTSDWHLGKNLEGFSRLDEQEKFLENFIEIVDQNNIDLVIIAGDIYDTGNPPARAEKLFYRTLKRLSNEGKRAILVIAGNHDNPDRLAAASPLAYEHGVILLGTPKSCAEVGSYKGFKILDAGEGYVEIEINGEKAVIITLPYPSEKRLNEIFTESLEEEERMKSYSERIGQIFSRLQEKYREDTINIAVSHLFVLGGEESDSERPIQLGGSLAVDERHLPEKAQYIALGHLHKPQRISSRVNAYYSGSPLQYSKSEVNYAKCCYIVDVKVGESPSVEQVYFKNYKPIEIFKCSSIEEAIEKCRENKGRDIWAYLEIKTDRVLTQSEIKEMKELIPDIIEIKPIIDGTDIEEVAADEIREKNMIQLFREFYSSLRGVEASEELIGLFLDITKEEGEDDEACEA